MMGADGEGGWLHSVCGGVESNKSVQRFGRRNTACEFFFVYSSSLTKSRAQPGRVAG